MKGFLIGTLLGAALLGGTVNGKVKNETLSTAEFQTQRSQIEQALAEGTTYPLLNAAQKAEAHKLLQTMTDLLEGHTSSDTLKKKEKIKLFNSQEQLNVLLNPVAKNEDRVVCRREHTVGTHRPKTLCRTAAEREAAARISQEELHNMQSHSGKFPQRD